MKFSNIESVLILFEPTNRFSLTSMKFFLSMYLYIDYVYIIVCQTFFFFFQFSNLKINSIVCNNKLRGKGFRKKYLD